MKKWLFSVRFGKDLMVFVQFSKDLFDFAQIQLWDGGFCLNSRTMWWFLLKFGKNMVVFTQTIGRRKAKPPPTFSSALIDPTVVHLVWSYSNHGFLQLVVGFSTGNFMSLSRCRLGSNPTLINSWTPLHKNDIYNKESIFIELKIIIKFYLLIKN